MPDFHITNNPNIIAKIEKTTEATTAKGSNSTKVIPYEPLKSVGTLFAFCTVATCYATGKPVINSIFHTLAAAFAGSVVDKCLEARQVKPKESHTLHMEACKDLLSAVAMGSANYLMPENLDLLTGLVYIHK